MAKVKKSVTHNNVVTAFFGPRPTSLKTKQGYNSSQSRTLLERIKKVFLGIRSSQTALTHHLRNYSIAYHYLLMLEQICETWNLNSVR